MAGVGAVHGEALITFCSGLGSHALEGLLFCGGKCKQTKFCTFVNRMLS